MNQFNIVIHLVSVSVFEFKYLIFTLYITLAFTYALYLFHL